MKAIITTAILINILGSGLLSVDIEFDHKRIEKELSKLLGTSEYTVSELHDISNISPSGNTLGRYFAVKSAAGSSCYYYAGRVFTCPKGGCNGNEDISGTTEYFDYLIIWNSEKAVETVAIFNYQATHGQEVSARGWLKQFNGYRGDRDLKPGKNIDAISGATKSVGAIVKDISERTETLRR